MERFPAMNIHFPPARGSELHEEMKHRATSPWSPQATDALGRQPETGCYYFHRDRAGDEPACTACIRCDKPGHWIVQNIVPDEGEATTIQIEQYKTILTHFESEIAEPAAEVVEGMTAIELSQDRLEDYFSPNAVDYLQRFCATSNQSDLGGHPSDQEKWIDFLICAYDTGKDIHCDVFGSCLKTAGWWPEEGIPILVQEYDFAFRLLQQSGR